MQPVRLLSVDDYERILATLEVVERATSVDSFRQTTAVALEEHLGYRGSIFFIAPPPEEQLQPTDGLLHGYRNTLDEYVERWRVHEAYDAPHARLALMREGVVPLERIYKDLDSDRRRYLHEFLFPLGVADQVATFLDSGGPRAGFLSIIARPRSRFGPRDAAILRLLRPHLTNLLRMHLAAPPAIVDRALLTPREAEVADLVARGWTNDEIAAHLSVTDGAVKKHVSRVLAKLGLRSRTQLAIAWNGPGASP